MMMMVVMVVTMLDMTMAETLAFRGHNSIIANMLMLVMMVVGMHVMLWTRRGYAQAILQELIAVVIVTLTNCVVQ